MKRLCSILLIVIIAVFAGGCSFDGTDKSSQLINGSQITPMPTTKASDSDTQGISSEPGSSTCTAVLIKRNTTRQTITVRDIYSGDDYVLSYTGGTDVKDRYDQVISMAQLEIGEILDVSYDEEQNKAKTVCVNKDAFESNNIMGFKATSSKQTITFGSASYMYTDNITVISGNKLITPAEILNRDIVTVRGISNKIYSVTVDKGHGYLTFSGIEQFIGGMVEIGNSFLYTVSEDMLIPVPEGEYEIIMSNDKTQASKTIYISQGATVTADFSDYNPPASKTGTVEFQILPKGTDLFIEGNKTEYDEPVVLNYGEYLINLVSDDYPTYTTRITVDSTYMIKKFDLNELTEAANQQVDSGAENVSQAASTTATAATTTTAAATTATTAATATTTTAGTGNSNTTAGAVTVNITEPSGAGVYVDNVYVGTVPLTINKNIGEYVITFERQGYITKSYIVDIDSTDGEQTLSFPEMSEE